MRPGVVRSGSGFRVILDRKDGKRPVPNPFHAAVIEVEVRHLKFRCTWNAALVAHDGKAVILRRDENVA